MPLTAPQLSTRGSLFTSSNVFADVLNVSYTTIGALTAIEILVNANGVKITAGGSVFYQVLVDSVVVASSAASAGGINTYVNNNLLAKVNVAAGAHTIQVQARYDNAGYTITVAQTEQHCRLLCTEVSR